MLVSLEFALYFYFISTAGLIGIFWFYFKTKDMASHEDYQYKGRQAFKECELCGATYNDSTNDPYSTCPKCQHLTPNPNYKESSIKL